MPLPTQDAMDRLARVEELLNEVTKLFSDSMKQAYATEDKTKLAQLQKSSLATLDVLGDALSDEMLKVEIEPDWDSDTDTDITALVPTVDTKEESDSDTLDSDTPVLGLVVPTSGAYKVKISDTNATYSLQYGEVGAYFVNRSHNMCVVRLDAGGHCYKRGGKRVPITLTPV